MRILPEPEVVVKAAQIKPPVKRPVSQQARNDAAKTAAADIGAAEKAVQRPTVTKPAAFARDGEVRRKPPIGKPVISKELEEREKARAAAAAKAEKEKEEEKALALKAEQEAKEKAEREAREAYVRANQELLASIIYCEAGNQPYEGQVAVGAVIMNRVKSGCYPNSIEEVIYQSGQFGPAATGWLNRVRSSKGYSQTALQAAVDALNGSNPIGSCLYFDQGGAGMKIGAHYFH